MTQLRIRVKMRTAINNTKLMNYERRNVFMFWMFILGMLVGGTIATLVLCFLQINKQDCPYFKATKCCENCGVEKQTVGENK